VVFSAHYDAVRAGGYLDYVHAPFETQHYLHVVDLVEKFLDLGKFFFHKILLIFRCLDVAGEKTNIHGNPSSFLKQRVLMLRSRNVILTSRYFPRNESLSVAGPSKVIYNIEIFGLTAAGRGVPGAAAQKAAD
jgi:hypothetical protein